MNNISRDGYCNNCRIANITDGKIKCYSCGENKEQDMTDTRTDAERLEALQKRADRLHTRVDRLVEELSDLNDNIAAYEPSPKMPGVPT